jgi:hypothetical protein
MSRIRKTVKYNKAIHLVISVFKSFLLRGSFASYYFCKKTIVRKYFEVYLPGGESGVLAHMIPEEGWILRLVTKAQLQQAALIFFSPVFRIRIHRIHMFLGLPYPDSLVRGMIRIRIRIRIWVRILLFASKNSKKNLNSYCFVTSFGLFIFENYVNVTFKKQKNFFFNSFFAGNLKVNGENRRIRIHWSDAWIRGSGSGFTPKCHESGTLLFTFRDETPLLYLVGAKLNHFDKEIIPFVLKIL